MDQININGANTVFTTIPAGFAVIDTSLPVASTVTLNSNESNADVLILSNGPGVAFNVLVDRPADVSLNATRPAAPSFGPPSLVNSWVKIVNNTTGQVATIKGTLVNGLASAGLAVAGGDVKLVFFDGANAPYTLT